MDKAENLLKDKYIHPLSKLEKEWILTIMSEHAKEFAFWITLNYSCIEGQADGCWKSYADDCYYSSEEIYETYINDNSK